MTVVAVLLPMTARAHGQELAVVAGQALLLPLLSAAVFLGVAVRRRASPWRTLLFCLLGFPVSAAGTVAGLWLTSALPGELAASLLPYLVLPWVLQAPYVLLAVRGLPGRFAEGRRGGRVQSEGSCT